MSFEREPTEIGLDNEWLECEVLSSPKVRITSQEEMNIHIEKEYGGWQNATLRDSHMVTLGYKESSLSSGKALKIVCRKVTCDAGTVECF